MSALDGRDRLASLPFAEQVALVDQRLGAGSAAEIAALLRQVGALRDHEPLAHAVRQLGRLGQLTRAEVKAALAALLLDLPDTGVLRLLRGLARAVDLAAPQLQVVVAAAVAAVRDFDLSRIAATCVLDRWLKNVAPDERQRLVDEAVDSCADALGRGAIEELPLATLVRVPGARQVELGALATRLGQDGQWSLQLERFAAAVLEVLEAQPKSLSQANAEELLSRRVYTDPGHFLVELLQNAEDAVARCWRVAIGDRQVAVWHDGVPFDARDVVGVLSIGQTTKRREQIGFFGVGFKSVYEVCERPQIYSGAFRFEIADVSIPRRLAARPAGSPEAGTLVVLPLRDPADPLRGPELLHRRALGVPAETLLALSSIERLEVGRTAAAVEVRRVVERRSDAGDGPGRVQLRTTEDSSPDATGAASAVESVRRYLVAADHFEGPARPGDPHRAERSPVLVAVALDEQGRPVEIDRERPTVFSYLPTAERSGLRLLLHAHFDLPVDRERLDRSSAWNRWALAQAGELLARLARRLVDEHAGCVAQARAGGADHRAAELAGERLDRLLALLPLREDLPHPIYDALLDVALERLGDLPLLADAAADAGARLAPSRAALATDPALAAALAAVPLQGGRRMARPLDGRARRVALELGAAGFGIDELVALLSTTLADLTPGSQPPVAWLAPALPVLLERLGQEASAAQLARLRRLPLLVDDMGLLHDALAIRRCATGLREVYGSGVRPLLASALEQGRSEGAAAMSWASSLQALGVSELGLDDLLEDLRCSAALQRRVATVEGGERLLAYLRDQPTDRLRRAGIAALPLFVDDQGQPRSLVRGAPGVQHGAACTPAWLLPEGPLGAWLDAVRQAGAAGAGRPIASGPAGAAGAGLPLLDARLARAFRPLLLELGAQQLDLSTVVQVIDSGGFSLAADAVVALHRDVIDRLRRDLSARVCDAVARSRIFVDDHGELRPLLGPERALVAADQDIRQLVPRAPWLRADLADLAYVSTLPAVEPQGAVAICRALLLESDGAASLAELLWQQVDEDQAALRALYGYLARHADEVPPGLASQLASAPIWLDQDGRRRSLCELRREATHPTLAGFYRAWGRFPLIDGGGVSDDDAATDVRSPGRPAQISAYALCRALRLDADLVLPDGRTLVADLATSADLDPGDEALRPLLLAALREVADELPRRQLLALREARIFRRAADPAADDSQSRSLSPARVVDWAQDASQGPLDAGSAVCFRAVGPLRAPLSSGKRAPLLDEEDERDLDWLLDRLEVRPAGVGDLVAAIEHDPALTTPEAARLARRALVELQDELRAFAGRDGDSDHRQPPARTRLDALRLWPDARGRVRPAREVLRSGQLAGLLGERWRDLVEEVGRVDGGGGVDGAPAGHAPLEVLDALDVLDEDAAPEAGALDALFRFADPVQLLIGQLRARARPGERLASQPAFVGDVERVVRLLGAIWTRVDHQRCLELPLVVNAAGWLVQGARQRASEDELELARSLPLWRELADPSWAAQLAAAVPDAVALLAPVLPPRRLLLALRQAAAGEARAALEDGDGEDRAEGADGAEGVGASRSLLADRALRQRLYRWLLDRSSEIEGDAEARAILSRTPLIPTAITGRLRPPCELVFDPELPDLGVDCNAAAEVPQALGAWLRRTYQLDQQRLEPLLLRVLEAHDAAVAARDSERSVALLRFVARTLGGIDAPEELVRRVAALPRAVKLRRRVRVEADDGRFLRPRQLLLPDPQRGPLLARLCAELPPQVASSYVAAPETSALLEALGAARDLPLERVSELLRGHGRREGLDAALALARYLSLRLAEAPALRHQLALDRAAWIPDGEGVLRSPTALHWPTPETVAVLGDRPWLYPHPELFHTVDETLAAALPFRRLAEASLAEVVARIEELGEAPDEPDEILAWLESGLQSGRLAADAVREALAGRPFLVDDQGYARAPVALLREPQTDVARRFGRRRGSWSSGRDFPRMADALGIGSAAGVRDSLRYLEEVAAEMIAAPGERAWSELLADEPELARCLPQNLALLAARRQRLAPAALLPLAAMDTAGQVRLCLLGDPRLVLPRPPELAEAAEDSRAPVWFPVVATDVDGDGSGQRCESYLAGLGVPTLGACWRPEPLGHRLAGDCTAAHQALADELAAALAALRPLLPRLRETLRHLPRDSWAFDELPAQFEVRVVRSLRIAGRLQLEAGPGGRARADSAADDEVQGRSFEMIVDAVGAGDRGRGLLVLTEALVNDAEEIAAVVCSELVLERALDEELVALLAELLQRGSASEMQQELDARGFRAQPAPLDPAPGPSRAQARQRLREARAAARRAVAEARAAAAPAPAGGDERPRAAAIAPERTADSARPPASKRRGLLARVRRWLDRDRDDEDRQPDRRPPAPTPPTPPTPPRPRGARDRPRGLPHEQHRPQQIQAPAPSRGLPGSDAPRGRAGPSAHADWFRPRPSVGPQLDPWPDGRTDRPDFGLAFAPSPLPSPFLYAPKQILSCFDASRQRWLAVGVRHEWQRVADEPPGAAGAEVALQGRLPAGEVTLPLPMYGRLVELSVEPSGRLLQAHDGRLLLTAAREVEVSYRVALGPLPDFAGGGLAGEGGEVPALLLDRTAPDSELASEALELVDAIEGQALEPLDRCLAVRDFIRERYRYDPTYLEDPNLARWLQSVTRGRANAHLAALHAGRDARALGRGVCYELNALCCELLRRVGVAAAVAVGWTLDRGQLAAPEHLWAVALLPTALGPRWYPVDAATTRDGRPLRLGDRPPGPWRVKGERRGRRRQLPVSLEEQERGRARAPARAGQERLPLADLLRVARHVERLTGQRLADEAALRRRCRQILADPESGRQLAELLAEPPDREG